MPEKAAPLTQFIFVNPHQSRLGVIHDAALASMQALTVPSENWDEWLATDYRKSVRALKRSQDADADPIVSIVCHSGTLSAAATLPTRKEALTPALKRTQVTGWDHKVDHLTSESPLSAVSGASTLLINDSLGMSTGKMAAQAAHAVMLFFIAERVVPTFSIILTSEEILKEADGYTVTDNGLTEIPAGSLTAVFKY